MVAPPPDFSDDESLPNSARGQPQTPGPEPNPDKAETFPEAGGGKSDDSSFSTNSKSSKSEEKQFVVEREGNFDVLSADELTASERAMLMPESNDTEEVKEKEDTVSEKEPKSEKANQSSQPTKVVPKPPGKPRPNTAATTQRRNVRPAQSPRPKSANSSGSSTSLNNFSYISPYAMTPEQKEHAREVAKKAEEQRREREKQKADEDRKRQEDSHKSYQAWLNAKADEENKRRHASGDSKQQSEQERVR